MKKSGKKEREKRLPVNDKERGTRQGRERLVNARINLLINDES